ncbi:MAG: hypothetical protein V4556_05975 [Bacteroidota bacterium]
MDEKNNEFFIKRKTDEIEEGLEGAWVYEEKDKPSQYLTFFRPASIGGLGKVILGTTPEGIDRTLQYEILVAIKNDIFEKVLMNFIVKTSDEVMQFQIDFMNSFTEQLTLIDTHHRTFDYVRLEPRKMKEVE